MIQKPLKEDHGNLFKYSDQFIVMLVDKMGTCFASPEEVFIKQGDKSEDMYYIMQGDCTVNIIDE